LLRTEKYQTCSANRYTKSNLFRHYTLYHELQYSFLGSSTYANKVFILRKKIIRIVTNTKPRDSCREVFMNIEIMTLYSQYVYALILYIVNNKHIFTANNEIHKYKTSNNNNLHHPTPNLSEFNNGAYIYGINFLTTFLTI